MNPDDLQEWFDRVHTTLEDAYLAHSEPWRQSGMSGPYQRWEALRRPVADCIDCSGSFLDIGCANGYLLECVMGWKAEGGITIDPFGLDISSALIELAKIRLPEFSDHFYTANAYEWLPPRRFDFVRTELVYVPAEHEREYILRLLEEVVAPGGKLLVANYMEEHPDPQQGLLPGSYHARDLLARLALLGLKPLSWRDGYDPVKNRKVRVAILDRDTHLS